MNNVKYTPEAFGLQQIAELDVAGSYEYDEVIVWRRLSDGTLWGAHDSGCSCPTPFAEHTLETLQPIRNHEDVRELLSKLQNFGWSTSGAEFADFASTVYRAVSDMGASS